MCKFHSKDFVHVFVNKRKNKFNRYNILARKKCVFILIIGSEKNSMSKISCRSLRYSTFSTIVKNAQLVFVKIIGI